MHRLLLLAVLTAALVSVATAAAATQNFQATFVNVYSQCPTSPPTLVFCGDGTIAGFGAAHSTAKLTGPLVPIAGSDCFALKASRTITLLADPASSLTLQETGTKCPPSASADANGPGNPYTVAKTYTIVGGTGVFTGATGIGTDINRSAGNSQVSVLSGDITLP